MASASRPPCPAVDRNPSGRSRNGPAARPSPSPEALPDDAHREPAPEARPFKTLTRALIERLGGLDAAAATVRLGRSRLADCQHLHTDVVVPVDVVARLEAVAGEPLITAELARRAGCVLVPVEPIAEGEDAELMAHIGRETGEAFAAYAEGMRDGALCPEDRARLARELGDLHRRVVAMMGRLVDPRLAVVGEPREAAR